MTQSTLKTAGCSLLLLASIIQGLQDVPVFHYKTKEALVGQNTSLPCFIENISTIILVSTEWSKKDTNRTKLVLYTPRHGYNKFVPNVTLKAIYNGTDKLMGTYLELPNINKGDDGTYICDLTTYPSGSLKVETELRVKDKIECDMNSTIEVNSGEKVTIHCSEFSNVTYTWSKDEVVVSDGASLHLLSVSVARAGLYTLTADTGNSRLQATFNITVFTQTTDYWADAASLSPSYNSSSGISEATSHSPSTASAMEEASNSTAIPASYSPSIKSQNTSASSTYITNLTNTQSEASVGFNHSETYQTTLSYNQSDSLDTGRTVRPHINQSEAVNTEMTYSHSGSTSVPFVHNIGTEYAVTNALNKTQPSDDSFSKAFTSSTSATNTPLGTASPRSTTDVTKQQDPPDSEGQSHLVLTLIIVGAVLLIIVALILYRRRVVKKRMDLPPPFKPPPPPVKYAAVRNPQQRFPTDRCNSVTAGGSMEMRTTFV